MEDFNATRKSIKELEREIQEIDSEILLREAKLRLSQIQEGVFPHKEPFGDGGEIKYFGLTKRELFAAMAMQGKAEDSMCTMDIDGIAQYAVRLADALLIELNKGKEREE